MEWISIRDGLPEPWVNVVLWNGSKSTVGYYGPIRGDNGWYDSLDRDKDDDTPSIDPPPTHWMPLADPPDEAKE